MLISKPNHINSTPAGGTSLLFATLGIYRTDKPSDIAR